MENTNKSSQDKSPKENSSLSTSKYNTLDEQKKEINSHMLLGKCMSLKMEDVSPAKGKGTIFNIKQESNINSLKLLLHYS